MEFTSEDLEELGFSNEPIPYNVDGNVLNLGGLDGTYVRRGFCGIGKNLGSLILPNAGENLIGRENGDETRFGNREVWLGMPPLFREFNMRRLRFFLLPDTGWCENLKCSKEKGLSHCYECEKISCLKGMLAKIRPRAFTQFARRYGEKELLNCLERNEQLGIVYHRDGLGGDYDVFSDMEELIDFIKTGKNARDSEGSYA